MNNILFFLTPKALCAYLLDDYTVSEGLLLMIWLTVIVLAVLKIVKEAFEWLFW